MGKSIEKMHFESSDYAAFSHRLAKETELLEEYCKAGLLSKNTVQSGFELELCLLNKNLKPAFNNIQFINQLNEKDIISEMSQSSIEMNIPYDALHDQALSHHQQKLQVMMDTCYRQAKINKEHLIYIGTLPTAVVKDYAKNKITHQQRYHAMDAYLKTFRNQQPQLIQLQGFENLDIDPNTSGLVGAMSSFQIHFRVSFAKSARLFNASLALSAPLVAISGNSPFVFGKHIWEESRIILYENALKATEVLDTLPRVSFGTGYITHSFMDLFNENAIHYHPMIPQLFDTKPNKFNHLRLHNGTIYRWNRPILGIDDKDQLHFRVEFRPLSAGPTIVDMMANAAFYYGITNYYANKAIPIEEELDFNKAEYNFYETAKLGLSANIYWTNNKKMKVSNLIINILLPQAKKGLQQLEINKTDIEYYLSIINERVRKNQTGSQWQTIFFKKNNFDFNTLVQAYLENQYSGLPVHTWLTN